MLTDSPLTLETRTVRRPSRGMLLCGAITLYCGALMVAWAFGVDPLVLIVDSADVAQRAPYIGFFSNVGILLWVATSAVCLFACRAEGKDESKCERRQLLQAGGLLTLALAVDDFFLIHDMLVPQTLCYGIYAAAALFILVKFHRMILEIDGGLFLIAGVCLAGSIMVDLLQNRLPIPYTATQIVEEGLKFVGVVAWSLFWLSAAEVRDKYEYRFQTSPLS